MKKFEYKMIPIANGSDASDLIFELNKYGAEHWEVISMIQSSGKDHFNILMKREILNEKYIENETV